MERIVITGATGFIGRNLAALYLDRGAEVYALVRPDSPNRKHLPKHENLVIVSCGFDNILDCVEQIGRADAFFHLAWGGVNREEIDSPEVQKHNIEGSVDCIKAAGRLNCRVFMDAGSRVEYGITEDGIMQEDMDCNPVNEYGKAKLKFYQTALFLCREYGMSYYHLRFFSVYGPGDHPWSIISTLARELPRGGKVSLSACRHRWNFMYIQDAVQAVYALHHYGAETLSQEESQDQGKIPAPGLAVNIASEDTRVLREFVEEVHRIAGGKGVLEYGTFVQAKEGALSVCPDISRLKALTGGRWKERYSFAQGIKETMRKEEKIQE